VFLILLLLLVFNFFECIKGHRSFYLLASKRRIFLYLRLSNNERVGLVNLFTSLVQLFSHLNVVFSLVHFQRLRLTISSLLLSQGFLLLVAVIDSLLVLHQILELQVVAQNLLVAFVQRKGRRSIYNVLVVHLIATLFEPILDCRNLVHVRCIVCENLF
jgi:hypothetical protein